MEKEGRIVTHNRKHNERSDSGQESEYIGGRHAVAEALRSGRSIHKLFVAEGAKEGSMQPLLAEARKLGLLVQQADKRKLDQLVPGVQHQGVVAQAAAYRYHELDELLERAAGSDRPPLLVLLDEIEDPHNLGSILRTADAAGAHGVIVPKRRSAGLTQTVAKVSAGAIEYVPVARVANMTQTIKRLKEEGYWVAGSDLSATQDVYEADLAVPLAIVIGNESDGMGRLVRESCDYLVKLPMLGEIQSLNASVAAGILLYEAVRQRRSASRV